MFVRLRAISTTPDRPVPVHREREKERETERKRIIVVDCFQKELTDPSPSEPADISVKLSIYSSPRSYPDDLFIHSRMMIFKRGRYEKKIVGLAFESCSTDTQMRGMMHPWKCLCGGVGGRFPFVIEGGGWRGEEGDAAR